MSAVRRSGVVSKVKINKAGRVYRSLRRSRPVGRAQLRNYVKFFLGIEVPDKAVCEGHNSPMDYLWQSFDVDFMLPRPANGDSVVWANRGGGKTRLAAVATLLDCIFKRGCQVRILGGSAEQASRMYEYLVGFLHSGFDDFLAGAMLKDRCSFINGSRVEVLTQSCKSVRGQHVQKLRCDEVELFDEEVFAAAKFSTNSSSDILAGIETISTMHRPYGLMRQIVNNAEKLGRPIFKWCLWETIEKCVGRSCSQCKLWSDCGGRSKNAAGYLSIDDCITQMERASRASFEAEMLCMRPSRENVVFDEFDPAVHVGPVDYDPNLPLYRTLDFGFVNPFVCLWIQVDGDGVVRVIDEYIRSRATIDVHAEEIKKLTPSGEESVAATYCDPAGAGTNDVTGTSAVKELRSLGIRTRYRRSGILEGIELVRRAIRTADGRKSLVISPGCARLIEALECYHYPDGGNGNIGSELPLKDGVYDHSIDALRYFFVNRKASVAAKVISRIY